MELRYSKVQRNDTYLGSRSLLGGFFYWGNYFEEEAKAAAVKRSAKAAG